MVEVQPLRKGSVLDCLMETSMWLRDSMLGIKVISLRQSWTVGSKLLLLQMNSLARRKPKKAGVKAVHSITWSTLQLWGG